MEQHRDSDGFSLVELLVIITIVGILATIVVIGMGGIRSDAEESACPADWRNLNTAVESYFVQEETTTLAGPGDGNGDFQQALADVGLIREVSEWYTVDQDGQISPSAGSPCIV